MESDQTLAYRDSNATQSTASEFEEELFQALSNIHTTGSFASFGALGHPPPANLFVDGIGELSMPLNEDQARQLIAQSRQAPFGKGSKTIVDTAVRNTWELDSSQFSFRNPDWGSWIHKLCAIVAERLGISVTIKAEIYKMLLYEKGAMFKPHTE